MADGTHVPRALAVVWNSGPQAASYLAVHGRQMEGLSPCGKSRAQFSVGAPEELETWSVQVGTYSPQVCRKADLPCPSF